MENEYLTHFEYIEYDNKKTEQSLTYTNDNKVSSEIWTRQFSNIMEKKMLRIKLQKKSSIFDQQLAEILLKSLY